MVGTYLTMDNKRGLFVHNSAIGDFLVALRTLEFYNNRFERVMWDYLGKQSHAKLGKLFGLFDRTLDFNKQIWVRLFSDEFTPDDKLVELLKDYSVVLNFVSDDEAVFTKNLSKCTLAEIYCIDSNPPKDWPKHIFQYFAYQLSGDLDVKLPETTFSVHPDSGSNTSNVFYIHPGASSRKKRWELSNFLQVADRLKQEGLQIVFLLGEVELEQFTSEELDTIINSFDILINEPLEKLAIKLSSARGYLGNDSGISHLAGTIGIPTFVVFTEPANIKRWSPLGPRIHIFPGNPAPRTIAESIYYVAKW